jgi:Uma2 family endonuclease
MQALTPQTAPQSAGHAERRFVLYDVPWWTYVALRDALDEHGGVKMTYLKGALELMRPSMLHEEAKTIIARLIEVWAMDRDVDLRGFGGATFRREAKERGLEPDECYKLGKIDDDGVPDIALEVIVTNPLLDKMAVYAGLGVPEVWVWRPDARSIVVHRLAGDPGESQTQLAKAYRAALQTR